MLHTDLIFQSHVSLQLNYKTYSFGRTKFKIIPTVAAKAVPDKVTIFPIGRRAPPRPITNIADAMIKLRCLEKSTRLSTNTRSPLEAITPYKMIDIPPKTAVGIVLIIS